MSEIINAPKHEVALLNDKFERQALQHWAEDVDVDRKPILKQAGIVFLLVFVFGGIWSCTAELGGAVIASGKVVAEGKNRLIQHLEGGILKDLKVEEGDRVEAGDVLATLDPIQLKAQLDTHSLQRATAGIQLARWRAEVHEKDDIEFPELDPALASHPRVTEAVSSQLEEFRAGQKFRKASDEIIDTRIQGLEGDIEGYKEVLEAYGRQLELFELELRDFKVLLEQGHISRTRVFATERKVVELVAAIANVKLDMKKAENEILNLQTEKRQKKLEFLQKANKNLIETQQTLSQSDSSVIRLTDMLERTTVKAPVNGTIFQLGKHTLGEVVKPGETLVVMFPDDDSLTIEAMLKPTDREQVNPGQDVEVVFPSDRKNRMKPVPGKLTYVSADTITSERDTVGHFIVKVRIDAENAPPQLLPGNLADVYIKTKPMTFSDVLISPFSRFAFRAFKG